MRTLKFAALVMLFGGLAQTSLAREPGVPASVPAGNTMGLPVAVNPPPGLYFSLRSGYWDAELKDENGDDAGQKNQLSDTAAQLLWVPGVQLLGGGYRAFVTIPFISNDQSRGEPFPPPLQGDMSKFGMGNIEISPIGLSWQTAPGIFVSAGLSIFAPTGDFDSAGISTGGDFWTVAPNAAVSYLRDGWNLTAHASLFFNTENSESDYRSGDEFLVNFTALKDIGGWSLGPVGYYRKQLTEDESNGQDYGGAIQGKAEQVGLGLGFSRRFGSVDANLNLTDDVYVRNAVGGPKIWLNLSVPIAMQ